MTNKHTPVPWSSGHYASETTLKSHERIAMPSGCAAGVWSMGCGEDEVKANARLIAAAPELLESLQLISQWREVIAKSDIPAKSAILEDFDDARAAIAKATGG